MKEKKTEAMIHLMVAKSYYNLSKALVYHIGLQKAFGLTDLLEKYKELKREDLLVDEEWFGYTREEMKASWEVSFPTQLKILKEFKREGLIESEIRGVIPQRNFFKLNFEKIDELFAEAVHSYIKFRQSESDRKRELRKRRENQYKQIKE